MRERGGVTHVFFFSALSHLVHIFLSKFWISFLKEISIPVFSLPFFFLFHFSCLKKKKEMLRIFVRNICTPQVRNTFLSSPSRKTPQKGVAVFTSSIMRRSVKENPIPAAGIFSGKELVVQTQFSKPLIWLHWIGAFGVTGLVVSGYVASTIPWDPKQSSQERVDFKKTLMHIHKSTGLLLLGITVPRLAVRFMTKAPQTLFPGNGLGAMLERAAAGLTHATLYGAILFMSVSGVIFGYSSGKGLPFFKWQIDGAPKEKADSDAYKQRTKWFFMNHRRVGQVLEFLVPLHIGAAFFHHFRGYKIFHRVNPFAK